MKGITSLEDVNPGDFYVDNERNIWVVESLCKEPTITLRRIGTDNCLRSGAIGSLNLAEFVKLVPEE